MDVDLPTQALRSRWEDVVADLDATAAELAADGWTTVTLHAGDATTVLPDGDRSAGIDVLVPGNEFAALESTLDAGRTFSDTAVFRQAAGGVAFLVCVFRDPEAKVAALVPAFYPQRGERAMALAEHALAAGMVDLHVHPLSRERTITFTIEKPELVFPEDWT